MKRIIIGLMLIGCGTIFGQNLPSVSTTATIEVNNNGTVGTATPAQIVAAAGGSTGTVTSVSVVSANGFAGTSNANATSPAITLTTTLANGSIAKSNGTGFVAAVAADFPTLNQNTTGTAANVTGIIAPANGGLGVASLTGYLKGNGASAATASATVPFADLTGATLQAVTGQGATTSNAVVMSGGITSGGQRVLTTTTLTSATTLVASTANEKIIADATSAAFTITLPTTPTTGTRYTFVKKNVTTNSVTIAAGGANTINGLATLIIYTGRLLYDLEFDGTDWSCVQ